MKRPIVIVVVLLAVLTPAAYFLQQRLLLNSVEDPDPLLRDALRRARAHKVSLDIADLQRPLPPESRNAAVLYQRLDALYPLGREPRYPTALSRFTAGYSLPQRDELPEMEAYLRQNRVALNIAHEAARRPACVFRRNWAPDPVKVTFPELASMRHAARLLLIESEVLALQGRYREAVRSLEDGLRLARHAGQEPFTLAYLVRIAIESVCLSGLRKILYYSNGSPTVARYVREAVEKVWSRAGLGKHLRTDLIVGWNMLECFRSLGPEGTRKYIESVTESGVTIPRQFMSGAQAALWSKVVDGNQGHYLDRMLRLLQLADDPFYQFRVMIHSVMFTGQAERQDDPTRVLARSLVMQPDEIAAKGAVIDAQAAVIRAAAAVLIWRSRHGRYPKDVEQAVGTLVRDPFDGNPLRYRLEGNGFVIHSIGADRLFDGGSFYTRPKSADAVFRFPRPAYVQ